MFFLEHVHRLAYKGTLAPRISCEMFEYRHLQVVVSTLC